jgi:hypothetical protein
MNAKMTLCDTLWSGKKAGRLDFLSQRNSFKWQLLCLRARDGIAIERMNARDHEDHKKRLRSQTKTELPYAHSPLTHPQNLLSS